MLTLIVAKASAPAQKSASLPGKLRVQPVAGSSTPKTQPNTPKKAQSKTQSVASSSGANTPAQSGLQSEFAGLHLTEEVDELDLDKEREKYKEKPGLNMKQEELVAKVRKDEEESGKKGVSLIVVGKLNGQILEKRTEPDLPRSCGCWKIYVDGTTSV